MFMGTGSDVGKSLIVAGLCRALANRGVRVAPFKPQNMSNNAAVTADGGEIGRAQALQARAARREPLTAMNPVLLKPEAETGAQLVVRGKRVGSMPARDYWQMRRSLMPEIEFAFRQLKDPHLVSFSPMHHWTDHHIRVHVFTCVLALQIAHLMRRHAAQAGLPLSVRELLDQLAGIQETVLIYPSTGGRPKARRMLTETTGTQDQLVETFDLNRWTPRT